MIKTRIFQKYFLMASSLILLFVVLGVAFNNYMMELTRPQKRESIPPIFIAKIVDRLNPNDKVKSLEELQSWQRGPIGPRLALVTEDGTCLYPKNCKLEFDWKSLVLPKNIYDFISVKNKSEPSLRPPRFGFFPPLGGGPAGGGPGGPDGPPPGPPPMMQIETVIIKLNNPQPLFLVALPGQLPPMPPGGNYGHLLGIGSLVVSLLLGIGFTIAIIYSSMKKGVSEADKVISEIKSGNLKSRFQVKRKDEFGQAMQRFNTMADEIEKLVHGLKTSEQARTKVLQELAHDLRTPLASLRNLVDTLHSSMDRLDRSTRDELLTLSSKEIDYFERLVEDLLFLAQLTEPDYADHPTTFNLPETILDVAEDCLFMSSQKGKKIELVENLKNQTQMFPGDQHPIKRLVRNAVENAFSFAKSKVTVQLHVLDNQMIRLTIADDGPGFKPNDLNSFGQRNVSRKLNTDSNGRVSLGLGSVVIKTICDVYHGTLSIKNLKDSTGNILGAEIRIELPYKLTST